MELTLRAADDLHIHLRRDERTPVVMKSLGKGGTARALVMPNTQPAIATGEEARIYRDYLYQFNSDCELLMTIKLSPNTTPQHILDAVSEGVLAGKQYPDGVTTNSENGVRNVKDLFPIYEIMQETDMVLSLHGEVPGVFVMDAESAFLNDLKLIHDNFPRLRIVLEHISTKDAVDTVKNMGPNVAATITDHHLAITLQDVVGTRLQPHHFCMPVAKRPEDRQALIDIVKSGHPSFFSGTDSAPHLKETKESACGCAGVFTSSIHMPLLAHLFNAESMLDRLENFTALFGAEFYRLERNSQEITLIKKPLIVAREEGGIVPFWFGRTLDFSLYQ
ncbi:MAG: dihydroorotase [Acidobacteria bacterium]|nr:MAG: dihydroorotase [Acidobacteriota bacterium]